MIFLGLGIVTGIAIGIRSAPVDKALINQRDSLRNAVDRAKLDSAKIEYYYQRKLKEVNK